MIMLKCAPLPYKLSCEKLLQTGEEEERHICTLQLLNALKIMIVEGFPMAASSSYIHLNILYSWYKVYFPHDLRVSHSSNFLKIFDSSMKVLSWCNSALQGQLSSDSNGYVGEAPVQSLSTTA